MPKNEVVISKENELEDFKIDLKPQIPQFPEVEISKLNIKYPLIPPYAFAHIFWDYQNKELVYFIEEPGLNPEERRILDILEDGIKELINISFLAVKDGDTVIKYLEKNLRVLIKELKIQITNDNYQKVMYYIYRDFVGLGKIEPFLCDYFIEDIECNGVNFPIYIIHRKYRNLRTNIVYDNSDKLATFVERLAQKCGHYISYATPLLDGALPDGSRVNATFTEDITSRGPSFTIRKFSQKPWPPSKLMQMNTISPAMLAYLWMLIEYEANIMIIGGTASGKTTLLNGLAYFIPPQARVVSIEDTRELNLQHSNWLPSVAREGVGLTNLVGQKYGDVSLFDLLKESFRQRPDYVIVGEVRGKEAYVLFQGMASGHPSFGTMHANSVDTMLRRLETPPINLSPSLVEILDVVVVMTQTKIKGVEVRRVTEIDEIISVKEGQGAQFHIPFTWNPITDKFSFNNQSYVFNKFNLHQGISQEELFKELEIRTKLLINLYKYGIFDYLEFRNIINEYYKDPMAILKRFNVK